MTRRLGAQSMDSLTEDERAGVLDDLTPRTRAMLAPGPQPVDAADELALAHGAFTVLARVADARRCC